MRFGLIWFLWHYERYYYTHFRYRNQGSEKLNRLCNDIMLIMSRSDLNSGLTLKPMFFLLPCFSKDPGKSNGRELFLYPSGQKTVKVGIAFPRFFRVWVRTEGDSRKPFASVIALQLQGLAQCLAHSRHSRMKKIVRYLYLSNSYTNFTFTLNNKKLKVSSFLKIASLSFFQ